jgi:hypothetical protein
MKEMNIMIDDNNNETTKKGAIKLEKIDYAILKLLTIGTWTTPDIVNLLQMRTLIVEKHIYDLTRGGFADFQSQYFVITQRGKESILSFEKDNIPNVWRPIEEFIQQSVENRKKGKIRLYKTVDFVLLTIMAILIILAIYVGIYY